MLTIGGVGIAAQEPGAATDPPDAETYVGTLFTGATLYDGTDGPPIPDARLVVHQGRVVCAGPAQACATAPGTPVIDLSGRWVGPGLIDAHVHLYLDGDLDRVRAEQALRFALGITTTRDAGSFALDAVLAERNRADADSIATPRVVVSARASSVYAERFGSNDIGGIVSGLAQAGVDGIKLKDQHDPASMIATIQAARAAGLPVSGHTWTGPPPLVMTEEAVAAGVDGVVHLGSFAPMVTPDSVREDFPDQERSTAAFYRWRKTLWDDAPLERLEPVMRNMIDGDVWLEPTLAFEYYFGRRPAAPDDLGWVREAPLGPVDLARSVVKSVMDRTPRGSAVYPDAYAGMEAFVRRFHEMGGRVVAGSDQIRPGIDLHLEIELLQRAGLTPRAALAAATRDAALAVGRGPDRGVLSEGRLADFVVYDADPLASPENRRRIHRVVKGGVMHDPSEIRAEHEAFWRVRIRNAWILRVALLVTGVLVLVGVRHLLRARMRHREGADRRH